MECSQKPTTDIRNTEAAIGLLKPNSKRQIHPCNLDVESPGSMVHSRSIQDQQQVYIQSPYPFVFKVGDLFYHVRCLFVFLRFNKGDLRLSTESVAYGSTPVDNLDVKMESIYCIEIASVSLEQNNDETDSDSSENYDDLDSSDETPDFDIFSPLSQFISQPSKDLKLKSRTDSNHKLREKKPSSSSKTGHDTEKRISHIPKDLKPVAIETAPINTEADNTFESISKLPFTTTSKSLVVQEPTLRKPFMEETPVKQKSPSKKTSKTIEPSSIPDYDVSMQSDNIELVPIVPSAAVIETSLEKTEEFVPIRQSVVHAQTLQSPNKTSLHRTNNDTLNMARSNLQRQLENQREKRPWKKTDTSISKSGHAVEERLLPVLQVFSPAEVECAPINTDTDIPVKSISELPIKTLSTSSDKTIEASSSIPEYDTYSMLIEDVPTVGSEVVIQTSPKDIFVSEPIKDVNPISTAVIPIHTDIITPFVVQTPNKKSHETSNIQRNPMHRRQLENISKFDTRVNLSKIAPLQDSDIQISPNALAQRRICIIPNTSAQHFNVKSPIPQYAPIPVSGAPELSNWFEKGNMVATSVMPAKDKIFSPPMQISSHHKESTYMTNVPIKCWGCSEPFRMPHRVGNFPKRILATDECPDCIELNNRKPSAEVYQTLTISGGAQQPTNFYSDYPPHSQTKTAIPILSSSPAFSECPYIWEDILEFIVEDLKASSILPESTEKLFSTNKDTAMPHCGKKKCVCCDCQRKNKSLQTEKDRKIAKIERELLKSWSFEHNMSSDSVKKQKRRSRPSKKTATGNSEKSCKRRSKPSKSAKESKPEKHPATGDMLLRKMLEKSQKPLLKRAFPQPTYYSNLG